MAVKRKIEDYRHVLIVEGYSDLLFYAEVLGAVGNQGDVFIKELGGKQSLLAKLHDLITPVFLKDKTKIGVIVDGNGNPAGAFASVQQKLAELTGQTVTAHGTWTGGTPDIGIFITPDGNASGEIETLVWNSWSTDPSNSAVKSCIEQYRDCMAAAGQTAKSPDKGLLSTLLAIRHDDDPRLGPGAREKVFDFQRPEFAKLRDFFSKF